MSNHPEQSLEYYNCCIPKESFRQYYISWSEKVYQG